MKKLKIPNQLQQYCKEKTVLHKILLLFFFVLVSSNVFSKSYSQTELQLKFRNTKIETIISFIERRTDYRFLYQTSQVDLKRKVSINFRGKISTALKMIFKNSAVYPVIVNKQIILKEKLALTQDRILTGTVTDEDQIPLEGVTVLVNKFERGTTTDVDGKYKINVKAGDKLSFSYLGFKEREFVISNQKVINVTLKEDLNILEEVVLVGYGKEKRANIATAISSVKGRELKTNIQSGASFERGLDGMVKGVFVTQGSGELGKGADIIIRGVTSPNFVRLDSRRINNNNPLYVIDGVAIFTNPTIGNNPLQSINPEDIESVEVLKDAAATAIYGSRGANGVIIVKTKTGMYDQPTTVNLSFKTTFGSPINTLDYLNATEFKEYILALNKNSIEYYNNLKSKAAKEYYGLQVLDQLYNFGFYLDDDNTYKNDPSIIKFGNANTNWSDVVFRTAMTNIMNTSVSGGGEKSLYNLSLGYVNQEGILRADKKVQYNARLSTQFDVSNKIKVGASVNYTNVDLKTGYSTSGLGQYSTSFGSGILQFRPDLPVYEKNGDFKYEEEPYQGGAPYLKPNPLVATTLSSQNKNKSTSILTNIFAEYDVTDNLLFKADFSYGLFLSKNQSFKPAKYSLTGFVKKKKKEKENLDGIEYLTDDQQEADLTELDLTDNKTINSSINYTLEYTKEFNKNSFKGLLGFSHTVDKTNYDSDLYRDFFAQVPLPQYSKVFKGRNIEIVNSGLNSYFARLSYNYDEKYGITAVARLDRSSRFKYENRNAFFPSIAANWNIHRENFMANSFLRELRLRASAGLTGSITVGDFEYVQKFAVGSIKYKETPVINFDGELANEQIKWEKTREFNIGLDFRLKRNILSGSIDFYHKTTSDVISKDYEIVSSGLDGGPRNNAKILNKGFELSLSSDIINTDNFIWSVNANASKNINRVLEVSGHVIDLVGIDGPYVVGRETNVLKGFIVNGIIKTPERLQELQDYAKSKGKTIYDVVGLSVGDYEYKDVNGDGTINGFDKVILGSRQPDLFGGFNTNLRYKGFNLSANFTYAFGLESLRYNQGNEFKKFKNIQRYMSPKYRWSPNNPNAKLSRLIHTGKSDAHSNRNSNLNIFDASYLRLTSVKLGYDLPEHAISNFGFSRVNLYISGTNLATWTNFPGLDPQGAAGGGASPDNAKNFDAYPLARTFSLGLNLKF